MRRRLADERGFTLVEMVIVSSLFLVVLSATLGSVAVYERVSHRTQKGIEHAERARRGVDRVMRQLRNLAKRVDQPVIQTATKSDFVFQTSDPTRTWVRHCLQARSGGGAWLWSLSSSGSLTPEMAAPCPGAGWARANVVASDVTNNAADRDFPLFSYGCVQGAPAGCPSTAEELNRITSVRMDLLLDDDLMRDPREVRVTSAVFLRNQNEPPVARFNSRPLTTRQVLLNASASLDPEGRTLRFMWFRAPAPSFTCDQQPPSGSILWQGVTLAHTFLSAEGPTATLRPIELVVCDPGDLQSRITQQVAIP